MSEVEFELKSKVKPDFYGKKILIAEDDNISFRLLEVILEKTKAEIIWARDGAEAFKLFSENSDIDLILMDINLPVEDGLMIAKKIRQKNKQVPIIAQTAFAYDDEKRAALSVGCNCVLTKPLSQEELIGNIRCLLD